MSSEHTEWQTFSGYKAFSDKKKLQFIVDCVTEFRASKHAQDIKILEIGCGRGNICMPLASLGFDVLAIDLNPEDIAYARRINRFDNLRFEICNAETIAYESKFDIIVCSEVLHHVENPSLLCKTLPELIKDDGLLIVTIPNGRGPYTLLFNMPMRFGAKLLKRYTPFDYKHNFSLGAFTELMRPFVISKMQHSNFLSFFPILSTSKSICKVDCRLADVLPHYMVSGWYFTLKMPDTEANELPGG